MAKMVINGMTNLIAATISFTCYAAFAVLQVTDAASLSVLKDVGMGGAFIITVIFIIRYFVAQIEKKDTAQEKQLEKYASLVERVIESEAETRKIAERTVPILESLNKKL